VFAISLYGAFLFERKPQLSIEVTSDVAVLDVKRPLPDLVVQYQGQDLRANKLDLRLVTARVANTGSADIELSRYDEREPIGIQVDKARFSVLPSCHPMSI
jgi:hypothetical protein